MIYNRTDLVTDIQINSDVLYKAYRQAKFIMERWNSGINATVLNDNTEYSNGVTGVDIYNFINRCSELVADYESNSGAKLNTILALTQSSLPDII